MCGQSIKKQSWGYGCTGYKDGCKFSINSTIAGKKIGDAQVKLLLTKGVTNTIKGFKSKAGKSFDAKLKLENNKVVFAFDNAAENFKEVKMKCPNCGDEIINDKWAWKCKSSCGFSVNHIIAEKTITSENVEDLITNGQTKLIKGFKSKAGKKFDAKLVLENNIKTKFEF
jgi:DNA topoisomerase-3